MINPNILKRFSPAKQEWLTNTREGQNFYWKFLMRKGGHILIRGQSDSGKTRKLLWLVTYLKELETIVYIDPAKDEEIGPLFFMGKKVNIIIPDFCTIDLSGIPHETYQVKTAYMPQLMWRLIEKDCINIISIHPYFIDEKERARFYAELFRSLAEYASDEEFFRDELGIERIAVCGDEAQRYLPSEALTRDPVRISSAQIVTVNILELRAFGIRFCFATQSDRNIFPGARDQMPATILCHGANVKSDVSTQLHNLCKFAEQYTVAEGLFVFSDGDYYPRTCPWPFPDIPKVKGVKIRYRGKFDDKGNIESQDGLISDAGRFSSQMVPREPEEELFSRFDIPMEAIDS